MDLLNKLFIRIITNIIIVIVIIIITDIPLDDEIP